MTLRYRGRLILAYISFFAAVAFSLLVVNLLGEAINQVVVRAEDGSLVLGKVTRLTLFYMALGLLGASLMRGVFDFSRTYLTDSLSQMVSYDIRNSMYDKFQHLSFAYHDKEHTGNLMSKVTSDLEAVRRFVNMGLVRSLEVVVRVVAIVGLLVYLNWELTLMSLAFVPFLVARSTMVMTRLRIMWLEVQVIMGQLVTVMQENLSGIHVVKAFAAEEHEKGKFRRKAQELRVEYFASERLQGTNGAWMNLYFSLALGLIIWYGGWEVLREDLLPGDLAMFVLLMNQITFPVRMTPQIISSFSRAISSGRRLLDVLDAPSPVEEVSGARDMGRATGHVRFEGVSFSYGSGVPALKNVNISAPPGSVVALLGAPGSGKSTIVNLLPRFYDVTSGSITIDGQDIRDFTLSSLRRNVGLVQQDVFLFSATVRDNIAYGAVDASMEDVTRAAKVAQLHSHIEGLPDNYETWVGERGSTLSGGQRQRLSIARTILLDPPVLILDDSTSSVDVETERMIHQAMVEVVKGRTTFVIAHRLSTVREADMILVLKDGEVAEQGSHEELMAKGGLYREIYDLQLRPQEEIMLDAILPSGTLAAEALGGNDGGDG